MNLINPYNDDLNIKRIMSLLYIERLLPEMLKEKGEQIYQFELLDLFKANNMIVCRNTVSTNIYYHFNLQ